MSGMSPVQSFFIVLRLFALSAVLALSTGSAHGAVSTNICHLPPPAAAGCQKSGAGEAQRSAAAAVGGGVGGGYTPAELRSAYKIPATGGTGKTIGIVVAYHHPAAEADLGTYRSGYGIASCTVASGCLRVIDQNGGTNYPPTPSYLVPPDWHLETSIDLDMASASCPACKLLLVEATDNTTANLAIAARRAVTAGATVVNLSWGSIETTGNAPYDSYFHNAGVPIVAASGDRGYNNHLTDPLHPTPGNAPSWPASHPEVISVGGTVLTPATNARGWSETVSSISGGGCSIYQPKPAWQTDPGCARRMTNDVAAVADPATPVSIYNSDVFGGWSYESGTSIAAPIVAGVLAQANDFTRSLGAKAFYQSTASLFDITSGSSGTCSPSYLCNAASGYDGPSGLGTPNGVPTVSAAACPEAGCTLVQGAYISHFTSANCTGTESYYTPYFGSDGVRRSWDGRGFTGTTLVTLTNRSWKGADGACHNDWPSGNTLSGFVRVYRETTTAPVQGAYISHYTDANCIGQESYYTPYFNSDGIRRSWDGHGTVGTILYTATNKSWKGTNGACHNDWPSGNTLSGFVRVYR